MMFRYYLLIASDIKSFIKSNIEHNIAPIYSVPIFYYPGTLCNKPKDSKLDKLIR